MLNESDAQELTHRKLDEAVLDAYGWPHDLSDEKILERIGVDFDWGERTQRVGEWCWSCC